MSTPDTPAALRAALMTLLPAGCAAWVSHDPGESERPGTGAHPLPDAGAAALEDPAHAGGLDPLWPEELATTMSMRPARLREFRHGRHCARRALGALGLPAAAIPVGARRAPEWPPGLVGSISHAGPWALAVTAPASRLRSLGADLEPDLPLDEPLKAMIGTAAEFGWLATQFPADPGKLAFSAKESVYKCLWPLTGRFIEFLEIELLPGAQPGSFRTAWRGPGTLAEAGQLQGRITVTRGFALTAAWLSI